MVDGPLGVDQPPAGVRLPDQVPHLPPSRAATRATGTRATVPGICSSDRNKPTSLAMRDNLWISRADGSLPLHVHKDVRAAWQSADSTSIRKLGDSAGTCPVMSTSAERQRSCPLPIHKFAPDDQGKSQARPTFQSKIGVRHVSTSCWCADCALGPTVAVFMITAELWARYVVGVDRERHRQSTDRERPGYRAQHPEVDEVEP